MKTLFDTLAGREKVLRRFSTFNGVGNDLREAGDYREALAMANLDYQVEKQPLQYIDGAEAANAFGIRIIGSNQHLGMVGKDYTPVNNEDAFSVAEELVLHGDMGYESGGPSRGAKDITDKSRSFLVLRGEDLEIGDSDTFNSFVVLRNSFDGSSGCQYRFILQRLACLNGMTRFLGGKKNQLWINIQHSSTVKSRIQIANEALRERAKEIELVRKEAEAFMGVHFTRREYEKEILPVLLKAMKIKVGDDGERQRGQERIDVVVQKALSAYDADDVQNYSNTAYKVLLACSDVESHISPFRDTNNPSLYFNRVLEGMVWTTAVANYIAATRGIHLNQA